MYQLRSLVLVCAMLVAVCPAMGGMMYESNQSMVVSSYGYQFSNTQPPVMADGVQNASGFDSLSLSVSRSYGSLLSADSQLTGAFEAGQATASASLSVSDSCANQWGIGSGNASASAIWEFTFSLAEARWWSLTGTTGADLQGSAIALYAYDSAGDTSSLFFKDIGFASSELTIDEGGLIGAGRYWLRVNSQLWTNVPSSDKTSGYDLAFSVSESPEPASLALLGVGALGLLRRMRR